MSFNTEKHFSSGASSVTVSYSIDNGCQGNVTFEKGGSDSFIRLDNVTSGVKISIDTNTGTSRTGHVYMKFNGQRCEDKTINIYQSGATPGPVDCILNNVTFTPNPNQKFDVDGCYSSATIELRGTSESSYTNCESASRAATKSVNVNYPKNESSSQSDYQVTVSGVSVTLTRTACDSPEPEPENQYLTIVSKAKTFTNTIIFKALNSAVTKTISASTDGEIWTAYTSSDSGTPIAILDENQKVFLRGENTSYDGVCFKPDFDYEVYGNIMSLIYGESYKENKTLPGGEQYVFKNLFSSSDLTSAEWLSLPAETLTYGCYYGMFSGCTSLTAAPELPATTLAEGCYNFMFGGCSRLETAPELKATEMVNGCYANMFYGCESLVNAPELPATTLANGCYRQMFYGCTSLTTAPDLPATTLVDECYRDMFNGCRNLNYIKCLATNASSTVYTTSWVYGVASSGTFIKAASMSGWTTGIHGIPEGWVVEDESDKYLTIKSLCNDNKIYFKSTYPTITKTVSASTDGNTWTACTSSSGGSGTLITTLNKNEKIWLSGSSYTKYNNVSFVSSGEYELYGNIMSLVNYTLILDNNVFEGLFSQSTKLKKAENLVLPKTSASYCYHGMFSGCTSLETAPKLPATTLAFSCYEGMFEGCTSLRTAPDLPATTLATQCYMGMFSGCTSLTTAPDLPATELKNNCYRSMFYGCTSLTTAPSILSATTLASFCYYEMFRGCTSLTSAPELPATTLASQCYRDMFRGCTSLVNVPPIGTTATTMAESACTYMFSGCTSLTTAPELPATTLAGSCYNGMFAGCTSLVDAPGLPVTTLANYCYYEMFYNCTSLTTAPNLPATTLANYCYSSMFRGCTSLTTAPGLPATTLASYCYGYMFYGCTKLNSITCLATDISATDCTNNWVSGVAESGTFTKAASMSSWATTGTSGIPSGWTVKDAQ